MKRSGKMKRSGSKSIGKNFAKQFMVSSDRDYQIWEELQQSLKNPSQVAPGFERNNLKKKKNSDELAGRMLQSLEWDLARDAYDLARNEGADDSREFMEGVREYTRSKAAKNITAKAIRHWANQS